MMQMTLFLHHNTISRKETFSGILVKIRHRDVILWHVTLFSYAIPYYDVIYKCADVSKNTDVIREIMISNKTPYVTL